MSFPIRKTSNDDLKGRNFRLQCNGSRRGSQVKNCLHNLFCFSPFSCEGPHPQGQAEEAGGKEGEGVQGLEGDQGGDEGTEEPKVSALIFSFLRSKSNTGGGRVVL